MGAFESPIPGLYTDAIADAQQRDTLDAASATGRPLPNIQLAGDCMAGLASAFVSYNLQRYLPPRPHLHLHDGKIVAILWGVCIVLLLLRERQADSGGPAWRIAETAAALRVSLPTLLLLLSLNIVLALGVSAASLSTYFLVTLCLLVLERQVLVSFSISRWIESHGLGRILIYDETNPEHPVISSLVRSKRSQLNRVVGVIRRDARFGCAPPGGPDLHQAVNHSGPITSCLLQSMRCTLLLVAAPHATAERQRHFVEIAAAAGARAAFVAGGPKASNVPRAPRINRHLHSVVPSGSWHYRLLKRGLDIVISVFLVILISPLLIVIALLIRVTSQGPAIFVQERVGRNGDLFRMYKFRSMHANVHAYQVSPKQPSDRRITGLGRFLRRMSLDELPQLFNVLKGDMSLVGPRPEMPFLVRRYTPEQRQRLNALPGITGLWQLSGCRAFPIHENIEYDLYYLQHRGIFLDVAILIHTAAFGAWRGI